MGEFRTLKGYEQHSGNPLSNAMEDYLEMICRTAKEQGFVRISQLSERLNVTPSSATKMAGQLKEEGYITYERYGYIVPTQKGWDVGACLLHRHEVLNAFLKLINGSEEELEQVEKIEHFINARTLDNIEKLLNALSIQVPERAPEE